MFQCLQAAGEIPILGDKLLIVGLNSFVRFLESCVVSVQVIESLRKIGTLREKREEKLAFGKLGLSCAKHAF